MAKFDKIDLRLGEQSPAEFEAQWLVMTGDDEVAKMLRLSQKQFVESLHVRLVHGGNGIVEVDNGVRRILAFLEC